ncbi:bifunctional proline dehydrogenase/L-glutamate gamma-semialdehyde dehydrogenase PutA [Uliginosibacterium paludis]|uniref:Bifunctional protein PutA n=1 Tax=Uliginosibacterium paludis TaxID=1615952 RepID=A0ABV2CV54_9RHOO
MNPTLQHLRARITEYTRRDEAACTAELAAALQAAAPDPQAVAARARELVQAVRAQRSGASGVDHLMHEFSLSSEEGVALMCVAEALLRIPDADTADRLIRDKLSRADWRQHLGHSTSLFVNAATWGLMITGKLVATRSEEALGNAFGQLVARCGEPVIRKATALAMQLLGRQFVMGENIAAALERSRANAARGYTHSFDMLGEAALTAADADRFLRDYTDAIHAIGQHSAGAGLYAGPGISVKLSALHPRYTRSQQARVMNELLPRLTQLAVLARSYDIGINIDAEEADRLDLSLDLLTALMQAPELSGWGGLGFVVQAYQKRAPRVIDHLVALARASGRGLMIRLVKGAYWDSEIKRAQIDGLDDYPVFTRKLHSDLSYLACAARMLDAAEVIYAQFATHNAHTLAAVARLAQDRGVSHYEFQCLHGMGEPLYDNVVKPGEAGGRCRIYAPVGSYETLLPYLVRRLLENGSNSSFVNRIVDERVSIDSLVTDPLAQVLSEGGDRHPGIPLPSALYGPERPNSRGLDLADEAVLARLDQQLALLATRQWDVRPLIAQEAGADGAARAILNPARHEDCAGRAAEATPAQIAAALDAAAAFAADWHATPVAARAAMLREAARRLEAEAVPLISLCIREAGKTRANAVAELREAVDFCRYYACQIEQYGPAAEVPGPIVAISPWNFPLAIFIGQISAALAAGSPVLAKPAEQTPLMAALAVRCLHEAGVPRAALQLLPGAGEQVGAALVADPRVRGILFTGSTEVALQIHRVAAAQPQPVRLIAETGGQNAMVVDSSAHLEQVVQDVLASAFDSAGQRCSALRLLCVQEEVAERLETMLRAAMRELRLGDPAALCTDVGPVIDAEALARLQRHVNGMREAGHEVFQLPLPEGCAQGCFMPPTLIRIASPADLEGEVFGPVVHLLRFARRQLGALLDRLNASGYGLTFGLHTRIDETVDFVVRRIHAGNVYVNRNMVGAVVGVQPFGGEGRSGTGPKAGGPLCLARLTDAPDMLMASTVEVPDAAGSSVALAELVAWAMQQGKTALAAVCSAEAARSPLGRELQLPGPTGERNRLRFAPRGKFFCVAEDEDALLLQIAALLATGNTPVLRDSELAHALRQRLPAGLQECLGMAPEPLSLPDLAGVVFSGAPLAARELRIRLAAREGAILPFVTRAAQGRYPLWRLLHERVLSLNTTAAGGNTSLMMLGG